MTRRRRTKHNAKKRLEELEEATTDAGGRDMLDLDIDLDEHLPPDQADIIRRMQRGENVPFDEEVGEAIRAALRARRTSGGSDPEHRKDRES